MDALSQIPLHIADTAEYRVIEVGEGDSRFQLSMSKYDSLGAGLKYVGNSSTGPITLPILRQAVAGRLGKREVYLSEQELWTTLESELRSRKS